MIQNYFILLIWNLCIYFLGIFTKYFELDIFEINLFNLFITFFGFITSFPNIILDKNLPRNTIYKLNNLNLKTKIKLIITCFPVVNFTIISYVDLDPIIINLLLSLSIIVNLIISNLYNKNYKLFNLKIFIFIIINIFGCILPIIFNDNFTYKLNNLKIGKIGIINIIIVIILLACSTTLNENIKNLDFDFLLEFNTFIIFTYLLIELLSFFILTPIFYCIQLSINNDYKINFLKIKDLFLYSSMIGLIYGFIYLNTTKNYIYLTSFDLGIIKNMNLIIVALLSCIFGISIFYYLYIPSIILITISSILIIYYKNKIINPIITPIENDIT